MLRNIIGILVVIVITTGTAMLPAKAATALECELQELSQTMDLYASPTHAEAGLAHDGAHAAMHGQNSDQSDGQTQDSLALHCDVHGCAAVVAALSGPGDALLALKRLSNTVADFSLVDLNRPNGLRRPPRI